MAKQIQIGDTPIVSAKRATEEANHLKAHWSRESALSQRVLIYCAGVLERIDASLVKIAATKVPLKKKRKPSPWQVFMGQQMSQGRTVKEAAVLWQSQKKQ